MTERITIEMTPGEALLASGALASAATENFRRWRSLMLTNAPAEEQDAAKVAAEIQSRVYTRLMDELYPPCDSLEECDRTPVAGERYCRFHLDRRVFVA